MQTRELAQARSLQQDDVQIGSYRVVTIEVFERERCYLDEFAISAPLRSALKVGWHWVFKAESSVGRECPCTLSKTGVLCLLEAFCVVSHCIHEGSLTVGT